MSEFKQAGNYDHVTPEVLAGVKTAIKEADAHRYSVSGVYIAYNAVMQKKDKPESCISCLRNRVNEMRTWLAEYTLADYNISGEVVSLNAAAPTVGQDLTPSTGARTVKISDNDYMFTPDAEDPNKGIAKNAEGKGPKPGTYVLADGMSVGVQPGGRVTFKALKDMGAPPVATLEDNINAYLVLAGVTDESSPADRQAALRMFMGDNPALSADDAANVSAQIEALNAPEEDLT